MIIIIVLLSISTLLQWRIIIGIIKDIILLEK